MQIRHFNKIIYNREAYENSFAIKKNHRLAYEKFVMEPVSWQNDIAESIFDSFVKSLEIYGLKNISEVVDERDPKNP